MTRIAVKMDDAVVPLTGVDELDKHLDELIADPTLATNIKLFDNVTLQLTGNIAQSEITCIKIIADSVCVSIKRSTSHP